eukprot:Clim_evm70s243 gene=Clim_evmTU70s243
MASIKQYYLHCSETPLVPSAYLTELVREKYWKHGAERAPECFLKLENSQPAGSFKCRGVGHMAVSKVDQGATRLVSSSGGNAGLAAAYAAKQLGVPITVFLPETTPEHTRVKLRNMGADVQVHGHMWSEADKKARKVCADDPSIGYIHPYDDPSIWTGHSKMIDEIKQQLREIYPDNTAKQCPQAIVCSVGGGGLYNGVITGVKNNGGTEFCPQVIAAETVGADCLKLSVEKGQKVVLTDIVSSAKSLGAATPSDQTFAFANPASSEYYPTACCRCTDAEAAKACLDLLENHRILVELACGAALAVAPQLQNVLLDPQGANGRPIVFIVCGGSVVGTEDITRFQQMATSVSS